MTMKLIEGSAVAHEEMCRNGNFMTIKNEENDFLALTC